MIEYKHGDMLQEDAEALVNTVNCVGVMGRGIALQFKKTFPENFKAYVNACKRGEVQPGQMFVFDAGPSKRPRYIINFPTKRHWRDKSRIDDIDIGLKALADTIVKYNICSIAIPPLGSGLGGLDWVNIKPRIEEALHPFSKVQISLYEPTGAPAPIDMVRSSEIPKMTPGRAALIELIRRYLNGLPAPFITLLEIHKLMYFMQEAGEPLKLNYTKALYGPYAENLRYVLNTLEGHFICGYGDGGDDPEKALELLPGATESAAHFLEQHPDTRARFDKVAELVEGFESSFGLELLSTVHWVITRDGAKSMGDVIDYTYAWNKRKQQFSPGQIELAAGILLKKNWLSYIHLR